MAIRSFQSKFKFLASLQLAVLVLVALSILIAIGTIVESRYDSEVATKWVYGSWWMKVTLFALSVNLTAVMVDRWPWKKKHIPFLFAHVGILAIILGSWVTQKYGLDGHLRIEINKVGSHVVVSNTDVILYQSNDGDRFNKVFEKEVDFVLDPPSEARPYVVPAGEFDIKIVEFKKYTVPQRKVIPSVDPRAGAGLRYQIQNERVNQIDWLVQSTQQEVISQNLGPATIHLSPEPQEGSGKSEIYLSPAADDQIHYVVYRTSSSKPAAEGLIREGDSVSLGWMDLRLKVLRYFPLAESTWDVTEKERPTPMTGPALRVKYQDKERWVLLNDILRMEKTGALLRFVYAQRRLPLKQSFFLKSFEIEKYQGTQKAAAYKSHVEVGGQEHTISMNEPLRLGGLLFYQASFEEDPPGRPVASILSVNFDPGRWLKYLGSLVMSLGIILLFYFKKYYLKK